MQLRTAPRPLLAHAAIVIVLLAFLAVTVITTRPQDGANIGGGLALLVLAMLGLPWSLPAFSGGERFDDWSKVATAVIWLGPALVNVALHAALVRLARHARRDKMSGR